MAEVESEVVETKLFLSRPQQNKKLKDILTDCGTTFHGATALLYAPHKCFLALTRNDGNEWRFYEFSSRMEDGKEIIEERPIAIDSVFEARVFNETAELRWLNKENGEGAAVILCEDSSKRFFDVEPKADDRIYARIEPPHAYLLWGESVGASESNGWTRFAEARIGSFFVPVPDVTADKKERAQLTAIEYLGEYEDGNVAVAEERLIGLSIA